MSDVWGCGTAQQLIQAIIERAEGSFVTAVLVSANGFERLAQATTITGPGYNPCMRTAARLAYAARGGEDVIGLCAGLQVDYPNEHEDSPHPCGVGLRLFRGTEEVGTIGLLGLPEEEAAGVVGAAAEKCGLSIA